MNKVLEHLKKQYKHKRVLIVGLGLQGGGVGLAKFFSELGALVSVTDRKIKTELAPSLEALKHFPISYTFGEHRIEDFLAADIIFKGPSVSWLLPEIVAAEKRNIPIEMEAPFFAQYSPAKIIGVTGTRGKSTTSTMIFHVMKKNNFSVYLAGNIPGISTISLLKKVTLNDWVILELPSWQLSGFHRKKISPPVAVFTNFYPDHLNYYSTMDAYLYDKKALYAYQKKGDVLIANSSLQSIIEKDAPCSTVHYFRSGDISSAPHFLLGSHNRENAAAALKVIEILGGSKKTFWKSLKDYHMLPYRLQKIAQKDTITFINDSTSTTPTSTEKALEAFEKHRVVLILGGQSKSLPFTKLLDALTLVQNIVLLKGSFTDEILPELQRYYAGKITKVFDSLESAVEKAYEIAKTHNEKTFILFSPAATSFAMFKNEFHRGEEFDRIVKKLY